MTPKKFYKIDSALLDKIIAVAYKDASLWNRFYIWLLSFYNKDIKDALKEYRATAKEVHQIQLDEAPDYLVQNILKEDTNTKHSVLMDFLTIIFNKPILSAVASTAVVAAIVVSLLFSPQQSITYSRHEIEKADEQARYALSIIGSILNKTNNTLQKDVLQKNISEPINNGIKDFNNLFKGGTK